MKVKLIVYLCVALLPYNIYAMQGSSGHEQKPSGPDRLDLLAGKDLIPGVLEVLEDGRLVEDDYGFSYKGRYLRELRPKVEMKFYAYEGLYREAIRVYTYLDSLNPKIESYGIPRVYYWGVWEEYWVIAFTLLDYEFQKKCKVGLKPGGLNEVDILIAFREFVRITKYIHSRAMRHSNIHYENLMFRLNRGFIIGCEKAEKFDRLSPAVRRQIARSDWKTFLLSMCQVIGVPLPTDDKENVPKIMKCIRKHKNTSDKLKGFFTEFAEFVFHDTIKSEELFYDYFYGILCNLIGGDNQQEPLVSWLTAEQKFAAREQSRTDPIRSISTI